MHKEMKLAMYQVIRSFEIWQFCPTSSAMEKFDVQSQRSDVSLNG